MPYLKAAYDTRKEGLSWMMIGNCNGPCKTSHKLANT
jgi:hypothetical protein